MATRKVAYSSVTTLADISSLNSLGTSATAAWQSDVFDNSSTLYIDVLVRFKIAAVNTAPANSKAIVVWVAPLLDGTGSDYDSTGSDVPSGTEGTITIPDFTSLALPLYPLGRINYPVQNKTLTKTFSIASALGFVPPKFSLVAANHTGFTIAASGNEVKWIGITETVA
jgi:hypothetical protein